MITNRVPLAHSYSIVYLSKVLHVPRITNDSFMTGKDPGSSRSRSIRRTLKVWGTHVVALGVEFSEACVNVPNHVQRGFVGFRI